MLRIGHRGDCGHAPENTLASFRKALEIGVDGVELDTHSTKDGEIIVMHDENVDRTTDGTGLIRDMTLDEIKKLDAGLKFNEEFKGEKVPTLKEALQLLRGKWVFIEIKQQGIEPRVIEIVRSMGMVREVCIVSFHQDSVKRIKEVAPEIKIGLISDKLEDLQVAIELGADAFSLVHTMVDNKIVKEVHKNGLLLSAWTMNTEEDLRKMVEIGADILVTDFPDRLNKILEKGDASTDPLKRSL
ncbi:hypothetical protein COS91_07015 [Candidatus Desantisbacteria bacterium CG07_land_8_20_14_0_80_39_15]|uniref:GP-PDE domain-containing protein n=2 Tax=unclassified Candidatus Desantisiibacteriota TaxID=3106372 RepID=A0A2H9PDD2_9BACT|nr:MAG: hypothetical protein COS91_07015 [Candidatus Desantisbacteria bacterium CG07_land_8_20_14_0_80_39_15]PIZ17439.1 MAG: hypothetical protein COY51_00095 [Candidatus Desantisbacteria bacterium CG_4_10_14_0_8_um_filter_39_17]